MNQDNIEPGRHYWILINNMKTIGLAAPDGAFI